MDVVFVASWSAGEEEDEEGDEDGGKERLRTEMLWKGC